MTVVKSFENFASGPYSSFTRASDGKLYGVASGGSKGYGVIFSFEPSSSTYTTLKDFDGINGGGPRGAMIQGNDGKLYGTTSGGGTNGGGVIFSFEPSTSDLYILTCRDQRKK